MKIGIEFEFFVSKDNKIIPAYKATNNLDGNPFLGELRTNPENNILDAVFALKKLIFTEQLILSKKGFKMEIIPYHKFNDIELIEFRKDKDNLSKKEIEVLEEFSIYPKGKLGKLLKRGEVKASLQLNFTEHKKFDYPIYKKITVEDKYRYEAEQIQKEYTCLFNYLSVIQKIDMFFKKSISDTKRVKGVYSIKPGIFGDRIEYRSLPNNINIDCLIMILQ